MTFTALEISYMAGVTPTTVTFRSDEVHTVKVRYRQAANVKRLEDGSPIVTYIGDPKRTITARILKKEATHDTMLALAAVSAMMRVKVFDETATALHDIYAKVDPRIECGLRRGGKTWEPTEIVFIESGSGNVAFKKF